MKVWKVSPYYWEKCAGDEPFVFQYAHTEFEAIQLTQPLPWNTTFGARAQEVKDDHRDELVEPETGADWKEIL